MAQPLRDTPRVLTNGAISAFPRDGAGLSSCPSTSRHTSSSEPFSVRTERSVMYAAVCVRSFRRYSTYRAATWARVFTNTVFGFILTYTYVALWHVRPHLGGYDLSAAITYVWIGQGLLSLLAVGDLGALADLQTRIASGDVAVDLFRPVDQQRWWLAVD